MKFGVDAGIDFAPPPAPMPHFHHLLLRILSFKYFNWQKLNKFLHIFAVFVAFINVELVIVVRVCAEVDEKTDRFQS